MGITIILAVWGLGALAGYIWATPANKLFPAHKPLTQEDVGKLLELDNFKGRRK